MTATGIRLVTPEDAEQVAAIYAPYVDTPISFELEPPGAEEMRGRIVKLQDCYPWLVYEDDGEITGYAYASPHRERAAYRWSVDVSVYVRSDQHRRGIGRALYTALFPILAQQGYCSAYAGITLPNPASVGLHTGLGFQPVGIYRHVGYKCGAWHDVGWYQLPLRSHAAPPPEIRIPPPAPARGAGPVGGAAGE